MVTCLGHGLTEIADAAAAQAERIAYMYNHFFTNDAQERLADKLIEVAAPEMARVRFVSGGSEANETMIRIIRQYHVDRGEPERWRIDSQAQSYHGATMGALALTGRGWLQRPFESYLPDFGHIAPSTWRFDPSGGAALDELDRQIKRAGAGPLPRHLRARQRGRPPRLHRTRQILAWPRRTKEATRVPCLFDEIVTGMGRTGSWFAYQQLPIVPDVVTAGKGLGAGYAPLAAALCRQHVFDAIAANSGELEHGHTWDGAPLPCAVGLAVMDHIVRHGLMEPAREGSGPSLREELRQAVGGLSMVREVRGRGFLLGVELVDPRHSTTLLPAELDVAELVDNTCEEKGLLVTSSHSSLDGMVGDQTLWRPRSTPPTPSWPRWSLVSPSHWPRSKPGLRGCSKTIPLSGSGS